MPFINTRVFGFFGLASLAMLPAVAQSGLTLNRSASVPEGFYRSQNGALERGVFVTFCPPEREPFKSALARRYLEPGKCGIGSYPMLKRIEGVAGDHYKINHGGIWINGNLIPDSAPVARDALGRSMPALAVTGIIQRGQMLVMGVKSPESFDSRYFGLIPTNGSTRVVPVLLWESAHVG
ncbi:conjugative transfer signal peptidase TraF [Novosphingobium terrae]|uniref:conjugative transfer signal peptidase TraF n=1 Tax=Novosphingobium terrae TaxID=2726189 RepID=UPI0019814822|nr:conjugative transfer signal peptidase TraF [Novosphingobium terrae]